ncbi:hypothetical protein QBC40DRAFT_65403 [Triangularia verruculosa]|uniref:Ecp2 effector protein domain-containing protein n=1 Tax=Triangularia verruculosa TaxID=2587418 RepID=A0AAN6XR57_9PEZI|nr:hypothetical protein QBC40DRAFT_65403 [Triangularia verruculosa]
MTPLSTSLTLTLLAVAAGFVSAQQQPALFHGTSVVILPSNETSSPVNSTVRAANFFCYMAEEGYFSFGWWVTPSLQNDTSHCTPDSGRYHWYEHASKTACDLDRGTCTFSTQNFRVREPSRARPVPFPERRLTYTIKPLDLGNGGFGQMAVSWIDDGGVMVYGVGTRQVLSGGGEGTRGDCRKAMGTLRGVYERYRPGLAMEVDWDLCEEGGNKLVKQVGRGGAYQGLGDL